jgi:hypothetical protein
VGCHRSHRGAEPPRHSAVPRSLRPITHEHVVSHGDPRLVACYLSTRVLDDLSGWAAQAADPQDADRDRALDIVRGILSPPVWSMSRSAPWRT